MKLIRFEMNGQEYEGHVEGDKIYSGNQEVLLKDVKILPPCKPTKAICIGLNYRDHAVELGLKIPETPVVFLKPPTCVIGEEDSIIWPELSKRVDYEAELAIVIKKEAKNISEEEAKDYILGYTCANDVTARDLQDKNGQWTVCKSFDTFLPLGPIIETELETGNLNIKSYVNGEERQSSNTKHLIFDVPYLVSYISKVMTLKPGDVILTGTPSGIGQLNKGDRVTVEIEGIGTLTNIVQ